MANNPLDTNLLDRAIVFAVKAHAGTERRGKGFPYIVHPLEAVSIVATITSDQELLAAAALHDVIEDTECTVDEIRREFGDRIAAIVHSESDNTLEAYDRKASWRDRKQAALDRLANASHDAKIVAMGDKLSNMRAIAHDYDVIGDKLWDRFHAPNGKADHEWRYRQLAHALFDLASTAAFREFCQLIDHVFGLEDLHAPHLINIDDYVQSGDGYTAISYNHKDGHTMIKLYNDFMPIETPIRELSCARAVARLGITSPMPGRMVTDGKRNGVEFERISPKKSFARAISQEPQALEDYAHRFAMQCKRLHQTECDCSLFPSAAQVALRIIDNCPYFNDNEKQRMKDFVNAVPPATTCIHGDMHIGNIITNGERDYWIDMGDFAYGNPLFDLGMFYFVSKGNPDREMVQHLYHITKEQIERVWDIFAYDYFGISTPEELEAVEQTIRPFAALRMMYYGTIDKLYPYMMPFMRETLLGEKE